MLRQPGDLHDGVAVGDQGHLGRSGLEMVLSAEAVVGRVVVDPSGLRVGQVDAVVRDADPRRGPLVSVVSGGVCGLPARRVLVPVDLLTVAGDRLRLDRPAADGDPSASVEAAG